MGMDVCGPLYLPSPRPCANAECDAETDPVRRVRSEEEEPRFCSDACRIEHWKARHLKPHVSPEGKIDREFRQFRQEHPEVEHELVRLARKAKAAGRERIGVGALWEVMRWSFWMRWNPGEEPFKLNNNHRSRYARLLMRKYPEFEGLFETRRLRS